MYPPKYTQAVGTKFHPDGTVRHYPGNTIICFCNPDENAHKQAAWAQQKLMEQPFAHKYTLLPLSSMHMTVIQLICDQEREPGHWSSKLALDTPLIETDKFFIDAVETVPKPQNFQMEYTLLWKASVGISMRLKPADKSSHTAIWQYRDAIADVTGVRFPDHEQYEFHISLAYQRVKLDETEERAMQTFLKQVDTHMKQHFGIFDSGKPYLTFFDDMFAFVTTDERNTLQSRTS